MGGYSFVVHHVYIYFRIKNRVETFVPMMKREILFLFCANYTI
jgi:hypothetical protein